VPYDTYSVRPIISIEYSKLGDWGKKAQIPISRMRRSVALAYPTGILYRAGIDLEAFPQFVELDRFGEELAVVVDDVVGEDGFPIVGRGDVGARRPVPCFGLLLGGEIPGEKKFCGVRMRRGFENCSGERPDGKRIILRKSDGLRQA